MSRTSQVEGSKNLGKSFIQMHLNKSTDMPDVLNYSQHSDAINMQRRASKYSSGILEFRDVD